jgi:hypothetical protein|tara:strand:- start:15758 stop:16300 length:543 start_codon:yes stop_codon:yes gene_type:complete
MMKKMMDKITVWLAVMIIIVMLASSLAGCVTPFSDEKVANEPAMNYDYETEFFNDSHAFTSLLRTGHMNQFVTDYESNNSTLTVHLNFTYRFEDRPFGQTGYLNLTLEPADSTGEMYYSQQWSGAEAVVNQTVNLTEVYDTVQLRIRAEGSDGGVSGEQQDYYELYSTYHFTTLNTTIEG